MNPAAFISVVLILILLFLLISTGLKLRKANKRVDKLERQIADTRQDVERMRDLEKLMDFWTGFAENAILSPDAKAAYLACRKDLADMLKNGLIIWLLQRATRRQPDEIDA